MHTHTQKRFCWFRFSFSCACFAFLTRSSLLVWEYFFCFEFLCVFSWFSHWHWRSSIKGATPIPSEVRCWMKKGWGQATGCSQCFDTVSLLTGAASCCRKSVPLVHRRGGSKMSRTRFTWAVTMKWWKVGNFLVVLSLVSSDSAVDCLERVVSGWLVRWLVRWCLTSLFQYKYVYVRDETCLWSGLLSI